MQKHVLLAPLGGSTLTGSMLSELRSLFPVGRSRISLLQRPHVKAEQKTYEALCRSGYRVELRRTPGDLANDLVRLTESEQVDALALIQGVDAELSTKALTETVVERVKVPVLVLQAGAQGSVLTTLRPAREHRPSDYAVEPLPLL